MKYLKGMCLFLALAAGESALIPLQASLADDGGTSSPRGGEIVREAEGKAALRDLVDNRVCIFDTGNEFARKYAPGLPEVLKRLSQANWYFAYRLSKEIDSLRFCLQSGRLKSLRTEDLEGLAVYRQDLAENTQLVAVRLDVTIYVDAEPFKKLRRDHRPYLLIHEAMHKFLPRYTIRRNTKLRNVVNAIAVNFSDPMSPEKLNLQLEDNDVHGFTEFQWLNSVKGEFLTAMDEALPLERRWQAAAAVGSVCREKPVCESVSTVFEDDWRTIQALQKQVDQQAFLAARNGDLERYRALEALGVKWAPHHMEVAARANRREILEYLTATGMNTEGAWYRRPAILTLYSHGTYWGWGSPKIKKLEVDCETLSDVFAATIELGQVELARALLQAGKAKVNAYIEYDCRIGEERVDVHYHPLQLAVARGDHAMIDMLIHQPGIIVPAAGWSSKSEAITEAIGWDSQGGMLAPLGIAVLNGDLEAVKLLVQVPGAHESEIWEASPAKFITMYGTVEMLKALVASPCARLDGEPGYYAIPPQSALETAVRRHNSMDQTIERVEVLLKAGAKLMGDELYLAVEKGSVELIRLLLQFGANTCAYYKERNAYGTTGKEYRSALAYLEDNRDSLYPENPDKLHEVYWLIRNAGANCKK